MLAFLLNITALSAIIFASGVQNDLKGISFYFAAALLCATVISFAYVLNESKDTQLDRLKVRTVPIAMPINLNKTNTVRVDSEEVLVRLAKKRSREVLVYRFSPVLVFYYVMGEGVTYLYVDNMQAKRNISQGEAGSGGAEQQSAQ
ncbi:MAG: hypothetical protein LBC69_00960 [Eubacteriaceae bacterium]|jgi:hypothetical protein|nr:hypothetical protein [Eubacteriaceae bacterium]